MSSVVGESSAVLVKLSSLIKEANGITLEIHRLNNSIKEFRARKKQIETQILQYMGDNQIPAMQYNDSTVILAETKIKKIAKKRDERIRDSLEIIRNHGIENPTELLDELDKTRYSSGQNVPILKIRNNLQL